MRYPSLEEVEGADRVALGRWLRFLESPGMSATHIAKYSDREFEDARNREKRVLDRILERFRQLGGWDSALSKSVGWGPHHDRS